MQHSMTNSILFFLRDIAPVASFMRVPNVMEGTSYRFRPRPFPEFITYAKANPGKINFAFSRCWKQQSIRPASYSR